MGKPERLLIARGSALSEPSLLYQDAPINPGSGVIFGILLTVDQEGEPVRDQNVEVERERQYRISSRQDSDYCGR